MRLLLTGASGFIGRRVVDKLVADGRFQVVAVSRSGLEDQPPGVEVRLADLLDPTAVRRIVTQVKPTHLLHLAWNATPGKFWTALDNLNWVAASALLMRHFIDQGGQRAVFAGTCAEYDWTGVGELFEDALMKPATFYGVAKDAARRLLCEAGEQSGVGVAWGRVFWLYGPNETRGRLVSDVAWSLAQGFPIETSDGVQQRDFIHVDDVAAAFVAALHSEWRGPFNIGSGKALPVRTIIETLSAEAGKAGLIRIGMLPKPPNEPPVLKANIDVLKHGIGYSPSITFEEGLAQTYQWWVKQSL